ncbi:hypothetical protein QSV34_12165 [Porticoccus sp. W117]|uniref:hypothetical protein n=1 Tax=Porticoccus sp. W117 TaxID=3054777 RepID=UPI002596937D|nr:hypothetical protein [Porticoccus sp. W117]MDM3872101.1 hypothetical protein [Porticoccus sp. W117]
MCNCSLLFVGKRFFQTLLLSLALVLCPAIQAADEPVLAIISVAGKRGVPPIFEDIVKGVEAGFSGKVKNYALKAGFSESRLQDDLRSDGVTGVVVLGGSGRKVAAMLSSEYPVVMGAVSSVPVEGVGAVVLQPSSEVVFDYLNKLAPDVSALHLIYDPKKHQAALSSAEKSSAPVKIDVLPHASSQSKHTQKAIEDSLSSDVNARSAIWVMLGTKFDTAIKENLIKNSWGQPVVPFHYTVNSKDVELFPFILLPDWQGLGQQLAEMSSQRLNGQSAQVAELQSVKLWVNQKKSRHFGLKLDGDIRKKIDFTFRD